MARQLKNDGIHSYCTAKGSHVGSGGRVVHFIMAIAHQKCAILFEQYEGKFYGTCSEISLKHNFKKLSFDARFQKAKRFFKMDVLLSLAYIVHQISIL